MQLPWVTAPENRTPDMLGSIGESLVGAAQAKQQRQQQAAAALRQQQQDVEAKRMHDAQIANYESEAAARKSQEEEHAQLRKIAAVKDIQASLDAGRIDEAKIKANAYKMEFGQAAQPITQMPGNTTMAPAPVDLTAPPKPGESISDVTDRNQAAIAANEPQAPKAPAFKIGDQTYDPAQTKAAEDAQREEEAKRVEGAYADVGFGKEAGAMVRGNTGKAPEVDQGYIAREKAKEAEANKEALLGQRNTFTQQRDERNKMTVAQQLSEAAKNRAARISAAQAQGGNARGDTADRGNYDHVDRVVHQAVAESGLPKLSQTMQQLDIADEELNKPSGAAQVGARNAIERALRGGPPTQYMDEQERTHIGGYMAKLEGALQTLQTGEFGEAQVKAIRQEIDAARKSYQKFIDTRVNAIGGRLASDPALQNMKGTVNSRWHQVADPLSSAPPSDIYPGEANALPPIGARSAAAAQPKTVGDRLTGAAKKPKSNEDDAARKKRLMMELSGG